MGELKYEDGAPLVYKAKVWNRGQTAYTENYKGRLIEIPAEGYIIMDEPEAADFVGEYAPAVQILPDGTMVEKKKPLRLERIMNEKIAEKMEEKAAKEFELICQICQFKAATAQGLKIHTTTKHPDAKPSRPAD